MKMPEKYYHCFMGNGEDAVLIGYTGSMVKDRCGGLEKGYWYKADRYYPELKLARPTPSRLAPEKDYRPTPETPWMESAPLSHTWYEIYHDGKKLEVVDFSQKFHPDVGWVETFVDYGGVKACVTTFLAAYWPLLAEHYRFDKPVRFAGFLEAGIWEQEGDENDPFDEVKIKEAAIPAIEYKLEAYKGIQKMWLDKEARFSTARNVTRVELECSEVTKYVSVLDSKKENPEELVEALCRGTSEKSFEKLFEENKKAIGDKLKKPEIKIPDEELQRFYDFSYYLFGAIQNRHSGGIPVNNLRMTWSSHVFWDAYFMQRALLEAGDFNRALESCRFFQRTLEHAKAHAEKDFHSKGFKWDWEVTHEGLPAYGTWVHQKEQVHNNASHSNQIWKYYRYTQDKEFLREFYPIIKGIAEFFLDSVIEKSKGRTEIKALVGINESPVRIKNEAANLSATVRILLNAANSAEVLGCDSEFRAMCIENAMELKKTLDGLYNGEFIQFAEGEAWRNEGSTTPMDPMEVIEPGDPRAVKTVENRAQHVKKPLDEDKRTSFLFPWYLGGLSMIMSKQRDPRAWEIIELAKSSICCHGGMSEKVFYDGTWNMMYFGTAHGAMCSAINHLLVTQSKDRLYIFNNIPPTWNEVSFSNVYLPGVCVSAEKINGTVNVEIYNYLDEAVTRKVNIFGLEKELAIKSHDRAEIKLEL